MVSVHREGSEELGPYQILPRAVPPPEWTAPPDPPPDSPRRPIHCPDPALVEASQMTAFTRALEAATGRHFSSDAALQDFCVAEYRRFWAAFLDWSGLPHGGAAEPVCEGDAVETARFFPKLELNYAEALLAPLGTADDAAWPAITSLRAGSAPRRLTRGALRERVAQLAAALAAQGLKPGDRVVAIARNDAEAATAALAVAALGATFSAATPEMGAEAILDRFAPLEPRLLLAHLGALPHDTGLAVAARVARVAAGLPSLVAAVALDDAAPPDELALPVHGLDALIATAGDARPDWQRFPFNHPLFILFSSGTTGRPKCIMHGAGGTLLEHVKELRLHTDLRPGDRLLFHTSCAWMMWNWQLSALATGAEIVLFDGPVADARTLWQAVAAERVTVFGTSPPYLKLCEDAGLRPRDLLDLGPLRAVLSTGSVLHDSQYRWLRDAVGDLPLQSISGGTDIIGCFVLGNPNLPVFAGEAQCRSLGLDVRCLLPASGGPVGELICAAPFPSRPVGFFGDPDGRRFHAAYFSQNPDVWTHGDLVEFTPEGGARMHGRSDGVMNIRGIRIGPADLYRALQEVPEIADAMVVEQTEPADFADGRAVLLLVLRDGMALDGALVARLRRILAEKASPVHVPDVMLAVVELPVTHSGKRSEAAMRDAVNGRPPGNAAALRNPGCLDAVRGHPALLPAVLPAAGAAPRDTMQALTGIWEALLGFAPIGPADDYFALGGHSLMAARLFAEIRRIWGRELPITTLLHAPTIEALAAVIEDPDWTPASRLVSLRPGHGRPFFMIHSMTGTVLELWALQRALTTPRPVHGIQARGLEAAEDAPEQVEAMAAEYIGILRGAQPHGPYSLGGYSFGGMIAFEMAQQLRAMGEEVDRLVLIDSLVHDRLLPRGQRLRRMAARPARMLRVLLARPAGQRLDQVGRWGMVLVDLVRLRLGRRPRYLDPVGDRVDTLPPALRRVRGAMMVAMCAYTPRPYAGRVTFIRAETLNRADPLPVWRQVAQGGIDVLVTPGDHDSMIHEEHAPPLAALLDRCLAE